MADSARLGLDRGGLLASNDGAPYDLLTPIEIERLLAAYSGVKWASQCDYVVQVWQRRSGGLIAPLFSALVMSANYPVGSISGSTINVGGLQVATVEGRDNAEISIDSYDYANGDIKRWFEGKVNEVVKPNGLMGLPANYAIMIRIIHGIRQDKQNYSRLFMCRPASMNASLSTEGTDLERLSMTFAQLDPFMSNGG